MTTASLFKWRHFTAEIIVCGVRWYLRYALSDRDVEELMRERGISVDHTTVFRWVQRYAPELDKQCRSHLTVCRVTVDMRQQFTDNLTSAGTDTTSHG
jgi:transposase, IS6 family